MRSQNTPLSPKLCRHSDGRAYVRLRGKFHYLGRYGTAEANQRYHALLAELAATGLAQPLSSLPKDITVAEAVELYLEHARRYYGNTPSKSSGQVWRIETALSVCLDLYAAETARDFGPLKLRSVQQAMIERGYTRGNINSMCGCIRLAFKWLASHELIPASVPLALTTVPGLRAGKCNAKEPEPVQPVPLADIEAVLPFLSAPVSAMVQLQLVTAARPGEIVGLTPDAVDRSKEVWTVCLTEHKTAYRGKTRVLFVGPKGQAILLPYLLRDPGAYCFSPREAEAGRHAACEKHRRSNQKPNPRRTSRTLGHHYTVISYRQAVERACRKAKIAVWTPNQLRHTAATEIRRQFGLDVAQVILGHSRADTTQIYAEADASKAVQALAQIG